MLLLSEGAEGGGMPGPQSPSFLIGPRTSKSGGLIQQGQQKYSEVDTQNLLLFCILRLQMASYFPFAQGDRYHSSVWDAPVQRFPANMK